LVDSEVETKPLLDGRTRAGLLRVAERAKVRFPALVDGSTNVGDEMIEEEDRDHASVVPT
jgi:hypothetical protein